MRQTKVVFGTVSIAASVGLLLSACSNSSTSTPSALPSTAAKVEAPIEITIAGFWPPDKDDSFVQKLLEQKFNVKFKNVRLDRSTQSDQMNIKLAAGEIPDMFSSDASNADMINWSKQGIIASISVDEIKKYMPKYAADIEKLDANIWQYGMYNGKNWGVPKVFLEGVTGFLPAYNSAWLKKIGYNEPPKTLAELEDVLLKFTNNDPDGNGKKDTYGMSARGKDSPSQVFNSVFAAFGTNADTFIKQADGTLAHGFTTEESRQALKLLNKWYKEGIIDPEFGTADGNKVRDNFVNAKTGYVDTALWYHLHETGSYGVPAKQKGVSIAIGEPLIGPKGTKLALSNGVVQTPNLFGIQVEKDEKKRIKILQMLEYMAEDEEGYLATSYGEKGVDYDLQGNTAIPKGDNGDVQKRAAKSGAGAFFTPFTAKVPSMIKFDRPQDQLDFKAKYTGGMKTITNPIPGASLDSEPKVAPTLKTLRDSYAVKAILGEVDTDKAFDDFVAAWKKAGGQELTDEVNKVYKERNKK